MKKITITIGCYNEEGNIEALVNRLEEIFEEDLPSYNYEIICIDNDSKDNTRQILRDICAQNANVKAIFNVKNFGAYKSTVYAMLQATGDCVIKMCADFQDPPEKIVEFIKAWEEGYKLVLGIKNSSAENKVMSFVRKIYYKIINKITEIDHIDNFMGFGLYDRDFIEILRKVDDPTPYLRGMVAEFGYKYKPVYYEKPRRRAGKSSYNFYRYYDYAMLGITAYSKIPLRIATFLGIFISIISFLIGCFYLVMKLTHWDSFVMGMAPVTIGVFFLGALQLIFIGLIGEYILAINLRSLKRPLVVEEDRLNFEERDTDDESKE